MISVGVEKGLLGRSDQLAKALGVSRAALIERGLKAVLAGVGKDTGSESARVQVAAGESRPGP